MGAGKTGFRLRAPPDGRGSIMRATERPFTRLVKATILSIPRGRVATYGQIAVLAGHNRATRAVAWILHASPESDGLPWHRVINARGGISLPRGRGFAKQRRRLLAEGVEVSLRGRIDLPRYQWEPDGPAGRPTRAAREFLAALTRPTPIPGNRAPARRPYRGSRQRKAGPGLP